MRLFVMSAITLACVVGVYFVLLPKLNAMRRRDRVMKLRTKLRRMTRDPEVAARLLAGEQERHPELDEEACLRRAVAAIAHDRR